MEKKKYIEPSMEEMEIESIDLLGLSGEIDGAEGEGIGYGGEADGSEDPA